MTAQARTSAVVGSARERPGGDVPRGCDLTAPDQDAGAQRGRTDAVGGGAAVRLCDSAPA